MPGPVVRAMAAAYRVTWCAVTALVCALGLAGGYVFLGPFAAASLAGLGALLGAAAAPWRPGAPAGSARRVLPALAAAVLPLAVIGLLVELGPVALLPCILLAVGGCPLRRRPAAPGPSARRRVRRPASGPPALETLLPDPLPCSAALAGLGTAELCLLWRISYSRLAHCTWAGERERLAELRRACLDELERRDPGAFARWVGTARAAGDPGRFFPGEQPRP